MQQPEGNVVQWIGEVYDADDTTFSSLLRDAYLKGRTMLAITVQRDYLSPEERQQIQVGAQFFCDVELDRDQLPTRIHVIEFSAELTAARDHVMRNMTLYAIAKAMHPARPGSFGSRSDSGGPAGAGPIGAGQDGASGRGVSGNLLPAD